ncbi:MAG: tetratricopeptide repeat protein, partial [Bacteroidia bacterium]
MFKKFAYCFFLYLIFCFCQLKAQNSDSLKLVLKNATHDSTRCNLLNRLIEAEFDDNVWPRYNEEVIRIAEGQLQNITAPHTSLDTFYLVTLSGAYSNRGYIAHNKGDYNSAILYYNKALDIEKKTNNKINIALVYNNIAGVYSEQKLHVNAIDYFKKSLDLRIQAHDNDGISQCYSNLGSIYHELKDTAKAKFYYLKALESLKKTNNLARTALTYNNLGTLYRDVADYKTAMEYFNTSLDMQTKLNNKRGMCAVLGNISNVYVLQGKYTEAKPFAVKAMSLAKELGFPIHIRAQAQSLYEIEDGLGHPAEALQYYKLYIHMRDSVNNVENSKLAMKEQIQVEYDKQRAVDKAVHEKELLLSGEREQKQKVTILAIGIVLLLMIGFAVFIYNRLQITNKQKKIIEEQKDLVEEKNHIIEEKQKEIIDSINYAKRIQHTLLANETLLNEHIPNHFIYFKPKDIVSGDFYWAHTVSNKQLPRGSELFYIAVCDSTGHGVPGAFMSLLNISFLNEAINEKNIREPHLILNHVRKRLIEEISRDGGQDGMDAVLLCIEKYE